ncbi:MAG: N-acetyl-gamma-glutamyl-phosphate reductase, partial [Colwellia sp.]
GGFRLKDAKDYPKYYGFQHANVDALAVAKYGLAEWQQDDIARTNLVAVPGCYPTASLLCLKPLTSNNLAIENSLVVVNGISGVSGAGRNASLATNFNEVSLKAYNVLQHRHQPEISQEAAIDVIFIPHLAPYKRGLLVTITLQLHAGVTNTQVKQAFEQAYSDKPLIRLVANWPEIGNVAYTPFADLHWQFDQEKQVVVISCAIDNLLKGAASQAIQCFNISLGLASEFSLIKR